MTYFVNEDQFIGMISIEFEDGSYFDDFAGQWEQSFFIKVFGEDLWKAFVATPDDPSMATLKDVCSKLFRWFFYFDYVIYSQSYQTTIGAMESESENAMRDKQMRNHKAVKSWNMGVDTYPTAYKLLEGDTTYKPLLIDEVTIERQNVWAI